MEGGHYVRGEDQSCGAGGDLDNTAEVDYVAQEKHGFSVRDKQEQTKAQSNDEQHYRVS